MQTKSKKKATQRGRSKDTCLVAAPLGLLGSSVGLRVGTAAATKGPTIEQSNHGTIDIERRCGGKAARWWTDLLLDHVLLSRLGTNNPLAYDPFPVHWGCGRVLQHLHVELVADHRAHFVVEIESKCGTLRSTKAALATRTGFHCSIPLTSIASS
jgi:hypothetical protein